MPPFTNPPILAEPPSDGDTLVFHAASGMWLPQPAGAGGTAWQLLTDEESFARAANFEMATTDNVTIANDLVSQVRYDVLRAWDGVSDISDRYQITEAGDDCGILLPGRYRINWFHYFDTANDVGNRGLLYFAYAPTALTGHQSQGAQASYSIDAKFHNALSIETWGLQHTLLLDVQTSAVIETRVYQNSGGDLDLLGGQFDLQFVRVVPVALPPGQLM